jgi:hypothetical protein
MRSLPSSLGVRLLCYGRAARESRNVRGCGTPPGDSRSAAAELQSDGGETEEGRPQGASLFRYTPDRTCDLGCPSDSLRVSLSRRAKLAQLPPVRSTAGVGTLPHPAVRPTGLVPWAVLRDGLGVLPAWSLQDSDRLSPVERKEDAGPKARTLLYARQDLNL